MSVKAVVINQKDNVATVVEDILAGSTINYTISEETYSLKVLENIPLGHKLAIMTIKAGEEVLKYGESIGRATQNIEAGQHVHVHNMESQRGRGDWNAN